MQQEGYKTPLNEATASIVEKKSEFIGQLAPVQTEEAALDFLGAVREKHRTAAHNVYAYVLREGARTRYSDDGEPAKTAGLPVLSAIQYAGLLDCIIVVTRYFGGTLLGTGGLVRAYTAAANAAIKAAGIATVRRVQRVELALDYALYEPVRRIVEEEGARLCGEPAFEQNVRLCAALPAEEMERLVTRLREMLRGDDGMTLLPPQYEHW